MENNSSLKKNEKNKFVIVIVGLVILIIALSVLIFIDRFSFASLNSSNKENKDSNLNSSMQYAGIDLVNNEDISVISPGVSPVTKQGEVLAESGLSAKNDSAVMSPEAPHQGNTLSKEDLPDDSLIIDVSNGSFNPNSFMTTAGAATLFTITSKDDSVHTIVFDNPALSSIAVSVGPSQTRSILFNAPSDPGSYFFRCITPGHDDLGEVGEMVVK